MTRLRVARLVTDFDSSVNMVRALGRFLKGKDHRGLSVAPGSSFLANMISSPPRMLRRLSFIGMGAAQGISLELARQIDSEDISQWVTGQYRKSKYDTVFIGSPSGAAVHLAAALRAPFLPQTVLIAVRDFASHPDEPIDAMERLAPTARLIARNNPDLAVYHMHDPAQDRPMLQAMAYMRLKRLRLGGTYQAFLDERLAPGATIIQLECRRTWRTRAIGERTYFQFGALGGIDEEEYHTGSERISEYLEAEGSHRRNWEPPAPDERRPEGEWGWDPHLADDLSSLAARRSYTLRYLTMEEPQDLSPVVSDFYRWWYEREGAPSTRLLCESYVQWDPYWVLRLGMVPFWLRFNMEPSYEQLKGYLEQARPYDRIYLNLFSQGLASPGVVGINKWRRLIETHAQEEARLLGVDEDAYPVDTGSSLRYQPAFQSLPFRHPIPEPLGPADFDTFLNESPDGYAAVGWS